MHGWTNIPGQSMWNRIRIFVWTLGSFEPKSGKMHCMSPRGKSQLEESSKGKSLMAGRWREVVFEVNIRALGSSCAWKMCQGFYVPIVFFPLSSLFLLPPFSLSFSFFSVSKIKVVQQICLHSILSHLFLKFYFIYLNILCNSQRLN